MKKIYFLQKLTSRAVYQIDLSQYMPNVSYRTIFSDIFRYTLDFGDMSETEYYDLLCVLLAEISGYNRSDKYYKNLQLFLYEKYGSGLYTSLRRFLRDHYKCITTTNIYFNLNPEAYGKFS